MVRLSPEYLRYYNEGRMYLNSGEYKKAIYSFDKAKLIFDNSYVYSGKGRAYYGLGKYEKALEYFEIAIKMYYSNIQAFHWRGKALGKLKKYDEAETQLYQTLSFLSNGPVNFYQEVLTDLNEIKAERSGKPITKKPIQNLNSEQPVTNIIIRGNSAPINLGGIQATDDAIINRHEINYSNNNEKPFQNLNSEQPVTNIIIQGNNAPINLGGIQATDDAIINRPEINNSNNNEKHLGISKLFGKKKHVCSKCGARINDEQKFCNKCGEELK